MKIIQSEKNTAGKFTAFINETEVGHMTYSWSGPQKLTILHTEVHSEFGGQGIGKKLVLHIAEFARNSKSKIKPMCTYAKAVFDKTPEIQDVLG